MLQTYWEPRPGRASRGFHGDGKQVLTASTTTAKCPAFHPTLGIQRDLRGAGCEVERERGDSEPEVRGGTSRRSEGSHQGPTGDWAHCGCGWQGWDLESGEAGSEVNGRPGADQ